MKKNVKRKEGNKEEREKGNEERTRKEQKTNLMPTFNKRL